MKRHERAKSFFLCTVAAVVIGVAAGLSSAIFLVSLDFVTKIFQSHPRSILFLPFAGLGVGLLYHHFGRNSDRGTNLIIDEIHDPKNAVPFRLAPLVLLGTLATHLFGGSAGREGTAVQMGGALADGVIRFLRFEGAQRSLLLLAGMAGGFASVFGTPLAGAVFGLEVIGFRGLRGPYSIERVFSCAVAAFVGHVIVLVCGVHHTHYAIAGGASSYSLMGFALAVIAGALFGVIGWLFANATHLLADLSKSIRYSPLRPFVGGFIVAAFVIAFGLERYTGLGVPVILESLERPLTLADSAWKFVLTVLTLGTGFRGGEVTPLFFIGSTFGNAFGVIANAWLVAAPLSPFFLAALGFVAVFGGAANVPLSATVMAMELFGAQGAFYFATACFVSYLFSGRHGIYRSQKSSAFLFKLYS